MTSKFPKTVYIVRNTDADDTLFLVADEDLKSVVSAADKSPAIVGIYTLTSTGKYRETVEQVK